jgi:hypothetical protein
MIKFTLTLWVCSFLGTQSVCMPPMQSLVLYESWYECSRAAHKESLLILSKTGYKVVNDNKIATRYTCVPDDSI